MPAPSSPLIRHTLGLAGFAFLRNADQSVESAEAGPAWEFAARSGAGGGAELKLMFEDLLAPFPLAPDAVVPAGSYTFWRVGASYHVSHTRLLQLRPRVEAGAFYDGWQATAEIAPVWYVSPHLELSGFYRFTRIRFPARDERFDAHLARLRIGTALDTKISTNAFLQYNSALHTLSANVRFRCNLREGNDLWLVYSETRYTVDDPNVPLPDTRAALIKYTHTFRW